MIPYKNRKEYGPARHTIYFIPEGYPPDVLDNPVKLVNIYFVRTIPKGDKNPGPIKSDPEYRDDNVTFDVVSKVPSTGIVRKTDIPRAVTNYDCLCYMQHNNISGPPVQVYNGTEFIPLAEYLTPKATGTKKAVKKKTK